ncbi:hypothetical protein AB1N83_007634 [Pleurotus pulmonarius]
MRPTNNSSMFLLLPTLGKEAHPRPREHSRDAKRILRGRGSLSSWSSRATVVAHVVSMESEGNSAEAERRGGSSPIPTTVPGHVATVNWIGPRRAG